MAKRLKPGDRVSFVSQPKNGKTKYEDGRVKGMDPMDLNYCFVVYHCNGNWNNYKNYTAQRTLVSQLIKVGDAKDLLSLNEYKKLNRVV